MGSEKVFPSAFFADMSLNLYRILKKEIRHSSCLASTQEPLKHAHASRNVEKHRLSRGGVLEPITEVLSSQAVVTFTR